MSGIVPSSITPSKTERFHGFNTAVTLTSLIAGLAPYALRAISPDYAGLSFTQLAEVGLGSALLGLATIKGLEAIYCLADIVSSIGSRQSSRTNNNPSLSAEVISNLNTQAAPYSGTVAPVVTLAEEGNLPTATHPFGGDNNT